VSLYGIDMSSLGQGQSVVFLSKSLAGGCAAGERNAELAGQSRGKGFGKQRFKVQRVFLVGHVEQSDGSFCAIDVTSPQCPVRAADLEHTQAVNGQGMCTVMGGSVRGVIGCRNMREPGGEGPSVGAEQFPANRVVVRVAEPGRQ
jgi:hypothetical protein